jgi:hypothetical protein
MHSIDVDYSRVLQPQDDGYDSVFFLALKATRGFILLEDPALAPRLGGRMHILNAHGACLDGMPLDAGNPHFARLEQALRAAAPAYAAMLCQLVDVFIPAPCVDGVECSSMKKASVYPGAWMIMASMTDDPVVAARNLMHELMHWKLVALGFGSLNDLAGNTAEFILNDEVELHHSIVNSYADTMQTYMRTPAGRPMGACIHGYTSFLAVVATTLKFAQHDARQAPRALHYAKKWAERLEPSLAAIMRGARVTPKGAQLLQGLQRWTDEVQLAYRDVVRTVELRRARQAA